MTTETCATCRGSGWLCARCGKWVTPPESNRRRDYGRGCGCYGSKSVRCTSHTPTTHRCDVCHVVIPTLTFLRHHGGSTVGCEECKASWEQWHKVAFDKWLETRPDRRAT